MKSLAPARWEVWIPAGRVQLPGWLELSPGPIGLVVFAHGSGSSRHSERNQFVARALRERGLGTLLFDLLTEEEATDRTLVFDIGLLADRVRAGVEWSRDDERVRGSPVCLFGASTGAAAALVAAAEDAAVRAVVSRGGRPDLAMEHLAKVRAPTLLIVGGDDGPVIEMNRAAFRALRCPKDLVIVSGASHLFEEPGTLERVAALAGDWFVRHAGAPTPRPPVPPTIASGT